MAKYRFFQLIMALSIVILIVSAAITCSFMVRDVAYDAYTPAKDGVTAVMNDGRSMELSAFDAWLEYSIVSDGLDGDSEDGFRNGSIYLSTENSIRLEQLRTMKSKASNGVFISIVVLVICFVVIKRRRLYECIVWGGAAGVIIGLISLLAVVWAQSGLAYGIKCMIFDGSYTELFPGSDALPYIIPAGTGMRVLAVYLGTICVGLVVTIVVRVVSYKKSRPHKFR